MILRTKRLLISEFTTDDSSFIVRLLNSPGWLQFIGDRGVRTEEDARNYLQNGPIASYAKNGFGLWKVSLADGNVSLGMCGLIRRESLEDVDIGFAMLPEFAGRGYAFEAAEACVHFARNEAGLKRLVAITMETNRNSIALLEKAGMRFEKKIQQGGEELLLYGMGL